ncbi:tyrosine-type recombinase/integrase [Rivularia sp. UHCC 0363]|uniref:tyrosine-type recombinase/integrase n=1 Tax=Rivularia sp. UHCC 0363 TaxID=3110244 RepID=UPI002B1EF656|nr:tyrosine-type recombinase/integrase [Rivularia sp. UHCC 0363]MEA5596286.1 tyrosine-type recombinase/integrase [Rivularia sp. UHCC 0363]
MKTNRNTNGTVGIESFKNRLRLRLPRNLGEPRRYLSLRLSDTPENHKAAQLVAWQIEEDINNGTLRDSLDQYLPSPKLTVVTNFTRTSKGLGELWDSYCLYKKSQIAASTYIKDFRGRYLNHINKLPTRELRDSVAIRDYLVSNLSPHAAQRMLTQLNACLEWAVSSGLVTHNPFSKMARDIKVVKYDSNNINPFTTEEKQEILKAFGEHQNYSHYLPFVEFLFLTGCRLGEAIGLKWEHISSSSNGKLMITFQESYSTVLKANKNTKTGGIRKFPCNLKLSSLLSSLERTSELVFPSPTGLVINGHNFTNRVWKGTGKYKGIVGELVAQGKVSSYRCPYNTRHTFISAMLENGLTTSQVAKLVGNSPEVILKHYASPHLSLDIPEY